MVVEGKLEVVVCEDISVVVVEGFIGVDLVEGTLEVLVDRL